MLITRTDTGMTVEVHSGNDQIRIDRLMLAIADARKPAAAVARELHPPRLSPRSPGSRVLEECFAGITIGETSLGSIERAAILATLEHFDGNKRHAADALGISLKTLYNKLNEYSGRYL